MVATCRFCLNYKEKKNDGKYSIIFELKKGLTFIDGSPITAQSVKDSIKLYQDDLEIKSVFRFAFKKIQSVIIRDSYNIELLYDHYSPSHLSDLTLLKILKLRGDGTMVSSGPYNLQSSKNPIMLKSRSNDFDIYFKVVKDETTNVLKLINDELDLTLTSISPRKLSWVEKNKKNKLNVFNVESTIYQYLSFNFKNKYLQSQRVREALGLALPIDEIIQHKLKNYASASTSFFSKAFTRYRFSNNESTFDPIKAERILDELGFKKQNGWRFGLDMKVSNNTNSIELANIFARYLRAIGINVQVSIQEWGTFRRNIKKGNFDLVSGSWVGFTGADIMKHALHSSKIPPHGANRGSYVNKKFDKTIDEALADLNNSKHIKNVEKAVKIINEDKPYINLWHPNINWVSRSCIRIKTIYPNGSFLSLLTIENNCEK